MLNLPTAHLGLLLRNQPLGPNVSASALIDGSVGGVVSLPSAGLTVTVPPGAFSGSLTIQVTALPGALVGYEFEPHGTAFALPLTATQDLTGIRSVNGSTDYAVGYFGSSSDVSPTMARTTERQTLPPAVGSVITFKLPHFSGYIAGAGRSSSDE